MKAAWHARSAARTVEALASDSERGLTAAEAAGRLAAAGPNELRRAERRSPLAIFAAQFASLVIWVLIAAALVSLALGIVVDAAAIVAIVLLNALIGFAQELRSERAVAALARLSSPRARVIRDGVARVVPAREVVRGDLLVLDAGDLVAADARVLEAWSLRTSEAPLTGESEPVDKSAAALPEVTPLAERRSLVFLGTSVAGGSGRALVTATGMDTEVGAIATLLDTASSGETPLQRRLDQVARRLLWTSLAIVALVFALGLVRRLAPFELFTTAVSLAVAAIPEGLPAVVTLALALGVERMARRNALVRRLPAVETLGATQVICTDKTGTLTVGSMTVRKLVTPDAVFGDDPTPSGVDGAGLEALLWTAAACNDAELGAAGDDPAHVGDPMEVALLVASARIGLSRAQLEADAPRRLVVPFDSERRSMAVVRQRGAALVAAVKGAPEAILERCTQVRTARGVVPLDDSARAAIRESVAILASDALRVLAFAERRLESLPRSDEVERELTYLGLAGLQDPPRSDAKDAVARCQAAGIRTVMLTGDHPDTARAIAAELGIFRAGDELLLGADLESLDDASLAARVQHISVYARVTAEHKLRIVRAWKSRGRIVAVTGDGVNDGPALREASIGVAMGRSGTEVAKEAADMVITDDRFSTIVAAVEEGRAIFDNIRKTLGYLLAGNAAELAVVLLATLAGAPLPLLPVQLLWINLVTDGLPALALATDPGDPDVLSRPPRHADSPLADGRMVASIALVATLTAGVTTAAFSYELVAGDGLAAARNAAFSVLVFAELLRAFGARSEYRPVWRIGLFSNLRLFVVVAASFALQVALHRVDALQHAFQTEAVGATQYVAWFALAAVPLLTVELGKVVRARQADGKRRTSSGPR